jgi:hypothetical protein
MTPLTEHEIREQYRVNAHAAACIEQAELGESEGRVNEAPAVRVLPAWLMRDRLPVVRRADGGGGC